MYVKHPTQELFTSNVETSQKTESVKKKKSEVPTIPKIESLNQIIYKVPSSTPSKTLEFFT